MDLIREQMEQNKGRDGGTKSEGEKTNEKVEEKESRWESKFILIGALFHQIYHDF